ncbi:MAG: putative metal-binding motif-containing protein, partial [Actinomycetes bacterium]
MREFEMGARRWVLPVLAAGVLVFAAACTPAPTGGGTGTTTTTTSSTTTTTAPPKDLDGDGYNELSDCNDNDASINPGAADPAGDEVDSNCDGIDGVQSAAVFVNSNTGSDTSTCGTITEPCASIGQGEVQAIVGGKSSVFVAGGSYDKFNVQPGLEVRGGYGQNWQRGINATGSTTATVSASFDASVGGPVGIVADDVTSTTKVADLTVQGVPASAGQNSYGVVVRNSSSALTLAGLKINGGTGGAGANGTAGASASQTAANGGANGANGYEPGGACNTSRPAGGGGASGPSNGGVGGSGGSVDGGCGFLGVCSPCDAQAGAGGATGSGTGGGSGGGGGQAGTDGLTWICTFSGGNPADGLNGSQGA